MAIAYWHREPTPRAVAARKHPEDAIGGPLLGCPRDGRDSFERDGDAHGPRWSWFEVYQRVPNGGADAVRAHDRVELLGDAVGELDPYTLIAVDHRSNDRVRPDGPGGQLAL